MLVLAGSAEKRIAAGKRRRKIIAPVLFVLFMHYYTVAAKKFLDIDREP